MAPPFGRPRSSGPALTGGDGSRQSNVQPLLEYCRRHLFQKSEGLTFGEA